MEGTFNMKQRIFEYFIFVPQHSIELIFFNQLFLQISDLDLEFSPPAPP